MSFVYEKSSKTWQKFICFYQFFRSVKQNVLNSRLFFKGMANSDRLSHTVDRKTGGKTIVEGTKDEVWGSGQPLDSVYCLDQSKWTSQGIMGEILSEIRESYWSSTRPINSGYPSQNQAISRPWSTVSECIHGCSIYIPTHHAVPKTGVRVPTHNKLPCNTP